MKILFRKDKLDAKKIKKWLIYSIILGLIGVFLSGYVIRSDPYKKDAEVFLQTDQDVQVKVGSILSVNLNKLLVTKRYRLYSFGVKGEKNKAYVVVRVEEVSDNSKKMRFSIESID